jgi:hypothetical protein
MERKTQCEKIRRQCPKAECSFVVSVKCVTQAETYVSSMYHNLGAGCRWRER